MVKKALAGIACLAALDAFSPPAAVRLEAQGTSPLVISQVYGGGGNLGATLTHDFIEIFNRGTTAVSLTGTAVRFTGTGWWNGQAGHTFVVESSDNGEPGAGLDTFAVTVRNVQGVVVLQAGGLLSAGNVDKLQ